MLKEQGLKAKTADIWIAARPIEREAVIHIFVSASDFSEKLIPLLGPMP